MHRFPEKLIQKLSKKKATNALRELPIISSKGAIDFTSNDYLGFARNKEILERAEYILKSEAHLINGATGSRLLSGNIALYHNLETQLAMTHNAESALVFNSGYDANIGFFSTIPQRNDIVFYDALIHASIRDGIRMGNAKSYRFAHNNLDDLKHLIENTIKTQSLTSNTEIYIVTESVFSMDGDSPDLAAMTAFCMTYGYRLIVDEAHAVGVFGERGEGQVQELHLEKKVFARIVTFGKAMGSHGAAVLGSDDLKTYLVNFARSFIYTTGLPPHTLATIIAAYAYSTTQEAMKARAVLRQNIQFFKEKVKEKELQDYFVPSISAIQSCIVSGNDAVKTLAVNLQDKGYNVRPILYPTVPQGKERLRFCLHSFTTKKEIETVLTVLALHKNIR